MAKIIVLYEMLPPSDEVLAHLRRAIEEGGRRVLGEPEIELVPNDHYIEGPDAPNEVYRLTFPVGPAR
jgi:hypothetical protein